MKKLAILGTGHIGNYVYQTLKNDKNFDQVDAYDLKLGHDLFQPDILNNIIKNYDGVLASTPFILNKSIANTCYKLGKDYFDLTESVEVTNFVRELSTKENCQSRFVTQCGLAPGMVSIIAANMASNFSTVENIEIRVGALPVNPTNSIGYYRTWNTEGLINEYIHPCPAIVNSEYRLLDPVDNVTQIIFDGINLEAANTSGGIGSLPDTYLNRAQNVSYQTLRYPGHWDYIKFLKDELGLKANFDIYVKLFNNNIPVTKQDVIYILINVTGYDNGIKSVIQYHKRILHTNNATAIQISTAGGVMAVLDTWNQGKLDNKIGWIRQEELDYTSVWNSQYANCYRN